ncbi:MAG: outer membrane beta-barrel protein [Muribaculaceae bacterium]|nr:outer membrane beta-barrel protein [Muribaculaceae bacterium]MDE7368425.1 outer membrane beta-barrel protein [Muribaculaceae bacterium]
MKRIFAIVMMLSAVLISFAADDDIVIIGRVKDALTKRDLTEAYAITYDKSGNVLDSIRCNKGRVWRGQGNEPDTISEFYFKTSRADTLLVFDVVCNGYKDKTVTFPLKKVSKRESYLSVPLILMERAPRKLGEVTVTSTKIKFYNKGDTLVYNADAFQLAEGSMLDQLIAQLPGAELSDDGQIKINGQFVESLLLNGKQFMDGNKNLMLDNIAAYTVKNINVYEGQKKEDLRQGNENAPKVLTMDVRLKKEYNHGWMGNFQAGYGTEDRYLGRAFLSWFNPTTRVSLVGNVNNLNDNRKPGRNDTWTPEKMPKGTKKYTMGAIDYNYESPDESKGASGSLIFEQTINNTNRTTSRTNFLPGGDTYDYSISRYRDREIGVRTGHSFYNQFGASKKVITSFMLRGNYTYMKNVNSDLSATFNQEQQGSVIEILDAMYSDGSLNKIEEVINRNDTRSDGWTKNLMGSADLVTTFRLPGSSLSVIVGTSYNGIRNELWNDYNVLFGSREPLVAYHRRNFTDNTPNHTLDLTGGLRYNTSFGNCGFNMTYNYLFSDRTKDSYMYALDRLNDMGIYGIVPTDYLEAFDPTNSYESRLITNKHSISPGFFYYKRFNPSYLSLRINPSIAVNHRHLDYFRNGRDYRYAHTNVNLTVSSIFDGMVEYGFQKKETQNYSGSYRNVLRYSYRVNPQLPNPEDMIDIVNDSDPMNIYYGNPALKPQIAHAHLFRWAYVPESHSLENYLYVGYNHTTNSLMRGYTYDTATGIRYNRMYNVGGNNRAAITNEINLQFGPKKQFTLSSETDLVSSNSTDMIGVNAETPELSKVHQNSLSENLRLGWQIGKQNLQLRCDYTTRHTTSTRQDFETLNAWHINYGVSGVFALPAGFGISTDFMCYTRRGYGSSLLDTTDPVWNARLTFSPVRNNHWIFNIDGFDLLHKLSNVTYAVTASGRTVAYTNALPRYILASVQYRFSIQPKK